MDYALIGLAFMAGALLIFGANLAIVALLVAHGHPQPGQLAPEHLLRFLEQPLPGNVHAHAPPRSLLSASSTSSR